MKADINFAMQYACYKGFIFQVKDEVDKVTKLQEQIQKLKVMQMEDTEKVKKYKFELEEKQKQVKKLEEELNVCP